MHTHTQFHLSMRLLLSCGLQIVFVYPRERLFVCFSARQEHAFPGPLMPLHQWSREIPGCSITSGHTGTSSLRMHLSASALCVASPSPCLRESLASNFSALSNSKKLTKSENLKQKLLAEQQIFTKAKNTSEAATRASLRISQQIARSGRPLTDGDFIKKYVPIAFEEMCLDRKSDFQNLSLSRMTVQRCVRYSRRPIKTAGEELGSLCTL